MTAAEAACDVVVVGGGNAGLAAAISAAEHGARVVLLEKAPETLRGGNTYFAGNYRFSWNSLDDDIFPLIPGLSDQEIREMREMAQPHRADFFFDDIMQATEGYADPRLVEVLVEQSLPTMKWLRQLGNEWLPSHRDPHNDYMVVRLNGGAAKMSDRSFATAAKAGISIRYQHVAMELLSDARGRLSGVRVRTPEGDVRFHARAVVLACGGFEANAAMRTAYLGEGWDRVKPRGVPFNTGDGLRMAWDIGAQPFGNLSGCHAMPIDINSPPHTVRSEPLNHSRYPFPWGILVNRHGRRFLDESVYRPGYTRGGLCKAMLAQPHGAAFQIFDAKTAHLAKKYIRPTGGEADTLEALARRLEVDPASLVATVREFNQACPSSADFNPRALDGRSTRGLAVDKQNWALPIDTPPYCGYAVGCGITFTFGGLRIDPEAQVMSNWEAPIPGLYACGEIAGGFWYMNYASGAGLTQGATFGRIAGGNAARFAKSE